MLRMDKDTNKNLKDTGRNFIKDIPSVSTSLPSSHRNRDLFYTKTGKLITALYMVTDMIDKEEPMRLRLRTLGMEIISDMHNTTLARTVLTSRIDEVVSLLNIASAMNFISEMNCAVLRKEFLELNSSISENKETKPMWLSEFLATPDTVEDNIEVSKGHRYLKRHTRIGIQKGSTLMQALSDRTRLLSGNNSTQTTAVKSGSRHNFDILKSKRRSDIIAIIKNNGGSVTIKDIKVRMNSGESGSPTYGEKTLQRELMSMTKEGILSKTGEKRWSRYSIKN